MHKRQWSGVNDVSHKVIKDIRDCVKLMKDEYNVLIVHNKYQLAGGEDTVAENEGKLLSAYGNHVFYYIRDNAEIRDYGLLKKIKLGIATFFSIKSFHEISEIIVKNKIDIVHVHNTVPLISCAAYFAAKKYGCALVQSIHNMRMLCPTGMMIKEDAICEECVGMGLRCAVKNKCYHNSAIQSAILAGSIAFHRLIGSYKKVDAYLVTTEFNRKMLEKVVDKTKIYMKPYYSDSKTLSPDNKERGYYIYISRLEHLKGIHVALQAFRKLPNQKLIVLGIGPDEEKSHKYVKDNNMTNVEFLGFKSKSDMVTLLYNAKALIFPTQWYEGFPMTIVESLAVGTPIIGSNIGNVGTIIQDGISGLTFQYDDPEDLISKIEYFENNPAEAMKMEQGAQKYFIDNHTPENIYKCTMRIYEDCLSE